MAMYYQENNKYPDSTNDFNYLKNNVLDEYGELEDISNVLASDSYNADNDSDPKTYKLELVSSKSDKTYIVTPNGVTTSP